MIVDINHPDRSIVLLTGLGVFLRFFDFGSLPVKRVFIQIVIFRIAVRDTEVQGVAVVAALFGAVVVTARVTTRALCQTSLAGWLACVGVLTLKDLVPDSSWLDGR